MTIHSNDALTVKLSSTSVWTQLGNSAANVALFCSSCRPVFVTCAVSLHPQSSLVLTSPPYSRIRSFAPTSRHVRHSVYTSPIAVSCSQLRTPSSNQQQVTIHSKFHSMQRLPLSLLQGLMLGEDLEQTGRWREAKGSSKKVSMLNPSSTRYSR